MKNRIVRKLFNSVVAACVLAVGMVGASLAAPVNINKAGAEEIAASLKGIGIKKAKDVVVFREKHGAFKSVEQLRDVKGFGEKTLEKNRQDIRLQ